MSDNPAELGSYSSMIEEYVSGEKWIGAAELPLVFHLRKLALALDDNDAKTTAAMSSTFLQTYARLERRRPGAAPAGDPQQTSIFDELD